MCKLIWMLFLGLVFFADLAVPCHAQETNFLVLYPQIREPYKEIFDEIILGVRDRVGSDFLSRSLPFNYDPVRLNKEIQPIEATAIITLGQRGLQGYRDIDSQSPLVIGGVRSFAPQLRTDSPSQVNVSFIVDPELTLTHLKRIAPRTKRVIALHSSDSSSLFLVRARYAVTKVDLELELHQSSTLAESARRYKEILATLNPEQDAIWLLQDSRTVDTNVILPLLLREAWQKKFVLISNTLAHTKRGTLISLFPDNRLLGRRLAEFAQALSAGKFVGPQFQFLKDVRAAVNVRTATHIDLDMSISKRKEFDLVFE